MGGYTFYFWRGFVGELNDLEFGSEGYPDRTHQKAGYGDIGTDPEESNGIECSHRP